MKNEIDCLKAEVERLNELLAKEGRHFDAVWQKGLDLQSRLGQAAAVIDYLSLHTELDAIAKSDIDKFYAGSTDAEKAVRAEMVRVANESAEGGL